MKRILMLLLAVLMCFTVVACSSGDDEPDLAGTMLEGYNDAPFKQLIKNACEYWEKWYEEEDDDVDSCEVTYKFSSGWDTDKFDEGDYINLKQSAVTCTVSMTTTSEGHSMRETWEFYFVHNHETNTLKAVGMKSCYADDNGEETYYRDAEEARGMLDELFDEEDW